MNEQLPDGLQLAVNIIRAAEWAENSEDNPLDAVLNEHAANLAQRAADLEAANAALLERVGTIEGDNQRLEAERDELCVKHEELLVVLHGIGKALGIPNGERSPYSIICGVLERVNRLAEIEAQEPVFYYRPINGGRTMTSIDEIMGAIGRHGDDCIWDDDTASESFEALREMIAAALADARREGAEQMQAGAFDACVAQADADRRFAKSERNAGAVDCATELAEIIRALPLATGERQPVRHVGDSRFESWFSMQPWSANTNKQHCRDSYAAGMGDSNG